MKKRLFLQRVVLCYAFAVCALFVSYAAAQEGIGMVTGSTTGTYFRFGQEIADKAKTAGIDIIVKESKGSIANIERLMSDENAAFAMVQSDVLGFLKRSDNPKMRELSKKLRLIFPFYNEEVHVFANKSITRFEDLEGKRVIIGAERSGNWLTSNNLLHITGVKPGQQIQLDPPEAVTAVLKEEADAMIYVVGKPAKLFTNLDEVKSKYPQLIDNVHFLPLDNPKILQEYGAAQITSADYSWFNNTISTVAVKAVLICYDFSSRHNDYYRKRCEELSKLGQAIRNNIENLKQTGHPKWKEVNLEEKVGIWEPDSCSRIHKPKSTDYGISNELLKMLKKQ